MTRVHPEITETSLSSTTHTNYGTQSGEFINCTLIATVLLLPCLFC
jgi:hypothetical protein